MIAAIPNAMWGEIERHEDEKGRVIVPDEFREALGSTFVVTRGPDRCIYVFPIQVWQGIEEQVREQVLDRDVGFIQRMFGGRCMVKVDAQARMALPRHLREWAQIDRDHAVVIVGLGQKLEIWSKPNWDAYNAEFTSARMYGAVERAGLAAAIGR